MSGIACVKAVIKRANGRLKFLYRYKDILCRDIRKIISLSLIQCHIDYACMAWYFHLPKMHKDKLHIIQCPKKVKGQFTIFQIIEHHTSLKDVTALKLMI